MHTTLSFCTSQRLSRALLFVTHVPRDLYPKYTSRWNTSSYQLPGACLMSAFMSICQTMRLLAKWNDGIAHFEHSTHWHGKRRPACHCLEHGAGTNLLLKIPQCAQSVKLSIREVCARLTFCLLLVIMVSTCSEKGNFFLCVCKLLLYFPPAVFGAILPCYVFCSSTLLLVFCCDSIPRLSFHRICGRNIELTNQCLVASRARSFNHALVFSNRPLCNGERFQVKLPLTHQFL